MFKSTIAASAVAVSNGMYFSNNTEFHMEYFQSFVREFGKKYESAAEESLRFKTFVNNLRIIDERNSVDNVHGITKFADLTPEEFRTQFLGYRPSADKKADKVLDEVKYDGPATNVDWSGVFTTPVKDQG